MYFSANHKEEFMNLPETIPCPLRELATRQPAGGFCCEGERSYTFFEIDRLVTEWQNTYLTERSVWCADFQKNSVHVVVQLLACLREGIPILFQNQRHPADVLQEQREQVESGCLPLRRSEALPGEWELNSPATILFTSGSSGKAKGIVHTAGNHWSSALTANHQAPLVEGDRWLCQLPLYHVGGLAILFRCLAAGATVCFSSQGTSVSEAVNEMNPSHLSLVPTQVHRWIEDPDFDPRHVKRVLIGGAPLSERLRKRAEERGVPLAISYGMTETASQVSATPPGEEALGAGGILSHAEMKLSENNEILVRGPSVAMGSITKHGITSITDHDGWLHTHDCGRIEEGILYVEGRMDNQFISGGENIQPEAIEQALLELDGITEAVVVPKEDEEFGSRPLAWVDVTLEPKQVEEWGRELRKKLPGYMIPVEYRTLPEQVGLKRNREQYLLHPSG